MPTTAQVQPHKRRGPGVELTPHPTGQNTSKVLAMALQDGLAAQIVREENRALYIHCFGHALNLAVADTVKQSKVCHDALDTALEMKKLVMFSPKRNAVFDRIKSE